MYPFIFDLFARILLFLYIFYEGPPLKHTHTKQKKKIYVLSKPEVNILF